MTLSEPPLATRESEVQPFERGGRMGEIAGFHVPRLRFPKNATLILASSFAFACNPTHQSLAQSPPPPSRVGSPQVQSPATQRDVAVYSYMGAVNVCALSISKSLGAEKALGLSAEMVGSTLLSVHGGIIQGVNNNQKLDIPQLMNGSAMQILMSVKTLCYPRLPDSDKAFIDKTTQEIENKIKAQRK